MVNLNFVEIQVSCTGCNHNFKIQLGKLMKKKKIYCHSCGESIRLNVVTEDFRFTYIKEDPILDLESSIAARLN